MDRNKQFKERLDALNQEQRLAVDTVEGPVSVKAGPGTGKTQILTLRIANILNIQGADTAQHILALTFTNAGVQAMRTRLSSIIGSAAYQVNIFTFHSFCLNIISQYPDSFDTILGFSLASDPHRFDLLSSVLSDSEYKMLKPFAAPLYYVPSILSAISELKQDNYTPQTFEEWNEQVFKQSILESEESYYKRKTGSFSKGDLKPEALKPYHKNKELAAIYREYEGRMKEASLYDYNDVLLVVAQTLREDENLKISLQEQYHYIHVDEHQDSNDAQNAIVAALSNADHFDGSPNLFTVGDAKQAIYRFQGASLENFERFDTDYPSTTSIPLVNNYRSGQNVLDTAQHLIEHDGQTHASLSGLDMASHVELHEFVRFEDELEFVAKQINALKKSGTDLRECAIIYRENKYTDTVSKVLAQHGIPRVVMARENILDTVVVRDCITLLRVITNPDDNHELGKLLYSSLAGLSLSDSMTIMNVFKHKKRNPETKTKLLFALVSDADLLKKAAISKAGIERCKVISESISYAVRELRGSHFIRAFDYLIQELGYVANMLASDNSRETVAYYKRFRAELESIIVAKDMASVATAVEHFNTLEEFGMSLDTDPSEALDGVRLLTAHKSKGLEYEHVFIINLIDKVWGNKKNRKQFNLPTGSSKGDNDDERRLLYVALTRAKRSCTISYSHSFNNTATTPSQFIYELPCTPVVHEAGSEQIDSLPIQYEVLFPSVFEYETVRSMMLGMRLSASLLNNYYDCPAKFFVRNLLAIPISENRSLIYGNVIHASLDRFFSRSVKEKKIAAKDVLLDIFEQKMENLIADEKEVASMRSKGINSLEGYYEHYAQSWILPTATEQRINGVVFEVGENTITATGVIDKIQRTTNGIQVVDYKTGKSYSEKDAQQKSLLERQMIFYDLLLGKYRNGYFRAEQYVLDFVEPNKKDKFEQYVVVPNDEMRTRVIKEIESMYNSVLSGPEFLKNRCLKASCMECSMVEGFTKK